MNIFFDIPNSLQISVLTEWIRVSHCAKLISATCNEKRRAELQNILGSEPCVFDLQFKAHSVKLEWCVKHNIKFNGISLQGAQLECLDTRKSALDSGASNLETVNINLTHKDNKWHNKKSPTPSHDLIFDIAPVFDELAARFPLVKHLHLDRCSMHENMIPKDDFLSLSDYIASSTCLQSVSFYKMDIAEHLVVALCAAPCLECVTFNSCTFTPEALTHHYTKKSTSVHTLTISKHIAICCLFPNVTKLHIDNVDEGDVGTLAENCPLVQSLFMHVCSNITQKATIHAMGMHWLQLYELSFCVAKEELLVDLIAGCPSLTSIVTVEDGTFAKRAPSCDYPPVYAGSILRELRTKLDNAETLRSIVALCPHLHTLHIEPRSSDKSDSIVFPVQHYLHYLLNTNVKYLSINRCAVEDSDLLKLQHSNLQSLCISYCTVLTNASIVPLISTLPCLHTLQLAYCKGVNNEVVTDVPPLCPTLRTFMYTQNNGCGCCGSTTSASLFKKILPRLYPHVSRFVVDC